MNQEEIKKILPHRDAMLLVEEAQLTGEDTAVGRYAIKGDEWFLQGHFPGNPVVPGVILCEMMAQACCVMLAGKVEGTDVTPYFTKLDKVKFRQPVRPGDVFESHCKILRSKGPFFFAEGEGKVDGKTVVTAQFSFAVLENQAQNK